MTAEHLTSAGLKIYTFWVNFYLENRDRSIKYLNVGYKVLFMLREES